MSQGTKQRRKALLDRRFIVPKGDVNLSVRVSLPLDLISTIVGAEIDRHART